MSCRKLIDFADAENIVFVDNIPYMYVEGNTYRDVALNMYPLDNLSEMWFIENHTKPRVFAGTKGKYISNKFVNYKQVYEEKYDTIDVEAGKSIKKNKIAKKTRCMKKNMVKKNGYKDKLFAQNVLENNPYFQIGELEDYVREQEDYAEYIRECELEEAEWKAAKEEYENWLITSDRDMYDDYPDDY